MVRVHRPLAGKVADKIRVGVDLNAVASCACSLLDAVDRDHSVAAGGGMGATDDPHVPACRFHWRIQPVVIGPDEIPRIDDLEVAARMPELAALSAIVHGSRADGVRVVETAISALASLDDPNGAHYLDLVLSSLRPAARAAMEKLMTQRDYRYRVDWLRKANEEGREEGLEKGLLREARRALDLVLGARGISLSDVGRARVEACEDVATIERWLARAVTVSGEDDLFVTD